MTDRLPKTDKKDEDEGLDWARIAGFTLVVAIHAFRMPAFFVVAGYFAMRLLRGGPTGVFLRDRARRLLLPAMAILLSFNLAQVWFLAPAHPAGGFVEGALLPALRRGDWLGHLWFLV